jgi:hypothetical protein
MKHPRYAGLIPITLDGKAYDSGRFFSSFFKNRFPTNRVAFKSHAKAQSRKEGAKGVTASRCGKSLYGFAPLRETFPEPKNFLGPVGTIADCEN